MHLMRATKIIGKSGILPSIVSVHPGLSPNWAEFNPKDMLSRSGLNNDFFHICLNICAGQLGQLISVFVVASYGVHFLLTKFHTFSLLM